MTKNLYYYDAHWLVERGPYMRLISEKAAKCFLDDICFIVSEYGYLLKNYPEEKYAQVDPLYYIHQNLGLLDIHLATDFFNCSFRGACWASLLIAINPHEKFLGLINDFLETCHPKNRWIANLALCAITNEPHAYKDKITTISESCKSLKKAKFDLRLSPSKEILTSHQEEAMQLRQSYQAEGMKPTLQLLKAKDIYQYSLNFNEWLTLKQKDIV